MGSNISSRNSSNANGSATVPGSAKTSVGSATDRLTPGETTGTASKRNSSASGRNSPNESAAANGNHNGMAVAILSTQIDSNNKKKHTRTKALPFCLNPTRESTIDSDITCTIRLDESTDNTAYLMRRPRLKRAPNTFDIDDDDAMDEPGWISPKQFHNVFYDGFYAPYILNPNYLLLLDVRSAEKYLHRHIVTSVNMPIGELKLTIPSGAPSDYLNKMDLSKFCHVVVCDSCNDQLVKIRELFAMKKLTYFDWVTIRGGFEAIEKQFPYMLTVIHGAIETLPDTTVSSPSESVDIQSSISSNSTQMYIHWYPAAILDHCLYLGRTEHALNIRVIQSLGITHIVNLTNDTPNVFPFVSYLYFPFSCEESLEEYFPAINKQISSALGDGGRVLVHCDLGVETSAAIVIAFLMMEKFCTLEDAHDYVKILRPIIQPSDDQLQQLANYEQELFGAKITCIDDLW